MSVRALLATVEAPKLRRFIKVVASLLHADLFKPAAACCSSLLGALQYTGTALGATCKHFIDSVLQTILKAMLCSKTVSR